MSTTTDIVYLNGKYCKLSDAHISPLDRGFLYGDSVYEVIPVYHGHAFRLEPHIERLERSLQEISLPVAADWQAIIEGLLAKNTLQDETSIYLQVTRGAYAKRDLTFQTPLNPTIFAWVMPVSPPQVNGNKGYRAITLGDPRWQKCRIKANTLLPNILAKNEALANGADDAIFLDGDTVLEGTASNVFIVKNNEIHTPSLDHNILHGITRVVVLELANALNIKTFERNIKRNELRDADEIWLTSSTQFAKPFTELDHAPVGIGEIGQVWKDMVKLFRKQKEAL